MATSLTLQDGLMLFGCLVLAKLGWELVSKIVWDWLKAGRNGAAKTTKLEDAPVTFGDMKKHCEETQQNCQNTVCEKVDGILDRLKRGDTRFESQERRYQRLERGQTAIRNQLSEIIRSNGKAEHMVKILEDIQGEIKNGKSKPGKGGA